LNNFNIRKDAFFKEICAILWTGAYSTLEIRKVKKYRNSENIIFSRRVKTPGEERGVHRVLVGKPEGKRPLGRPKRRWEDNIKMDV
jgi:hypothetical protein